MPYLSSEHTKTVRQEIKKRFPDYKISVTKDNNTIRILIKSGPIQLMNDPTKNYEGVNHFYINEHYKGEPAKVLSSIYDIANSGNGIEVMDSDYGAVPDWYVRISIGDWENPYIAKSYGY